MTKTKSAVYDVISVISVLFSMLINAVLGVIVIYGGYALIDFLCSDENKINDIISFIGIFVVTAICITLVFGAIFATRCLINKILKTILHCDVYYCNAENYADGFHIMRNNRLTRENKLDNLKTGGPAERKNDTYTVYLGMSYDELDIAIYRMLNKYKSVYYIIPHSHIMPDGVTCLEFPRITLRAAMQAKNEMREDETVFFVYYVDYPSRKSQLAHASEHSEVVIVDTKDVKGNPQ